MPDSDGQRATLDDVLAELKSPRSKKKDFWDRLAPVSTLILGVAGLWFTHSYNERQAQNAERQAQQDVEAKRQQARVLEMQAVEKFVPYLTNDDERQKEVALLIITTLGSPEFATQFARLNPSKGTQAAADRIMASAAPPAQAGIAVSVAPKISQAKPSPGGTAVQYRTGWVYLGHYVAQESRWQTRYFDFAIASNPASLVSSSLTVRAQTGNINVREGMPTDAGEFLRVREVLKTGSEVKVRSVKEWSSTGYMWAEIDYKS